MGKAGTSPITADSVVPYTKGVTYGQLCNMRRHSGLKIRTGQLMAYNGAWDRKAVVTHVTYMGSYEKHGYVYHAFTIGIQQLGSFYSTGVLKPSKCALRELQVETSSTMIGGYELQRWTPVQPFVPPVKQAALTMAKGAEFVHQDSHVPVVADNHPSAATLNKVELQNKAAKAQLHAKYAEATKAQAASKSPEAILAEFLIPTDNGVN
jgi:hypothetical protein